MSSNDSEKTVFRPPSVAGDKTVLRPMPGRRGSPQQQTPASSVAPHQAEPFLQQHSTGIAPPIQQQPMQQPAAPAYQSGHVASAQMHEATNSYFNTSSGLNPLVNAASILIAVFEKTRGSFTHPDVGGLHNRISQEIKAFEIKAKECGIQPEIVLSARYAVCVALDEAVLNTPWGSESAWPQRTMLSMFHNETSGGEKFFVILERMKEQPRANLDFLELMYLFLSLGFEGKYRVIHRGREMIEQLRDDLFVLIRQQRGEYERSLSPHWEGLGQGRNSLTHYIPAWVVFSIIGALLLLSYTGFRGWLYDISSPVVEQLNVITDMRSIARKDEKNQF